MQQQAPDHKLVTLSPEVQECVLALKQIILQYDASISTAWKFGMPFFYHQGKLFCYLWVHKKLKQPYISFAAGKHLQHPALLSEGRKQFSILLCDPAADLPLELINELLEEALKAPNLKGEQSLSK